MNSNPAYRSVVLDCLRDNASNMRKEHQDLARRIDIALEHSRANLLQVEKLNLELQKMNITVSDTMLNISKGTAYTKVVCENLLNNLINAAVEGQVVMPINRIESNALGTAAPIEEVSFEDDIDAI
ncbi:hypothetical protein KR038_000762, partial [Drosophila bunnanda]